ncbi:MAG TPA: GNAT family N-acetyltransferase [Chitinophagaceae bacterium]|nr:GNAT family N-acetyltransferase [Chitinophagaceae bacterium]
MKFLPVEFEEELNKAFFNNPACIDFLSVYPDFYKKVGFEKPWIGYFVADENDEIVACGGFKGKPKNGKVEIAYGTFPQHEGKGVATEVCKQLVLMALNTDKNIIITARTLPEDNASTRILKKNGFSFIGTIWDEDDGNVWEWIYNKA